MLWFSRSGPAVDLLRDLRTSGALRRWKIHKRARGSRLDTMIIGIGQMHPVLQGRFERFQAKRIGKIQGQIFDLCLELSENHGVASFGQEGLSAERVSGAPSARPVRARLDEDLLEEFRLSLEQRGGEERFLKKTALAWRAALRRGDGDLAGKEAMALNALTLLQALKSGVTIFPLEQEAVHGPIGEGIRILHADIESCEASSAFRSAKRKNGNGLTQTEYEAVVRRNALITQYNELLKSPERDRAIFGEVLRHVQGEVTVFILGQAHRHGMLHLAKTHLPPATLFVWLTPPSLWWWQETVRRAGWLLGVVTVGMVFASLLS